MKKKTIIATTLCCLLIISACSESDPDPNKGGGNSNTGVTSLAEQNILRAMEIADNAISCYFTGEGMAMSRYYNPYTNVSSDEKGSIWMYTSAIEAVNAIMHGLKTQKEQGDSELYDKHFNRYKELQYKLYSNAAYYKGTYTLTSYTQTKKWSVYGVDRGNDKGSAFVEGIHNVYDDQEWLIRELLEAYKLTNNEEYLTEAEYLTEYVLDGWDCTLDRNGNENGGIPWGPGYITMHSCSNGPMVSPLVWLHEIYKGKSDEITHRYIDTDGSRKTKIEEKSDYYLGFAKKIYDFQKRKLLRSDGVYADMLGGTGNGKVAYETINGIEYRKHTPQDRAVGEAYSYNSGTMVSGAADLYRATRDNAYLEDLKKLSDASFSYFAKLGATKPGYYTYNIGGFRIWFDGVLMRGYADAYSSYKNVGVSINSFQQNLDHGYDNFLYKSMLPTNLLVGWSRENSNNSVEGMFTFTFAAEYAVLSRYELEK